MKSDLKRITDNTINDLLQSDIILPSSYFQSFDKNAKLLGKDIKDESFQEEVSEVIVEEFTQINNYMSQTITNIDKLSEVTKTAKTAIANRDEKEISNIYQQIESLQKELSSLQSEMYIDSLTSAYNKKWLYTEGISKEGTFGKDGIMSLININDYNYVQEEHGSLIADNLIIFITDFIIKQLNEEAYNFKIIRYTYNKFIIFFYDTSIKAPTSMLNQIQKSLLNSTLKSKSGVLIKTSYKFNVSRFISSDNFQELLEVLISDLNK